jgi:protein gp37
MGEQTPISWCDHTFNCWWGCSHVSPGCSNCYAETWSKRLGLDVFGKLGERRFFGDKHWAEPLRWNAKAEASGAPKLVFCASMADVFEPHPAVHDSRERLWGLIEETPHLRWLLLTKRPENIARMVPPAWLEKPPCSVWYGTSVEDQRRADERIPVLLEVPAVVRFLSCEPLLGPVSLGRFIYADVSEFSGQALNDGAAEASVLLRSPRPDWVIVGGESGRRARPMHPDWARALRDQCVGTGTPFHFKQFGEWAPDDPSRLLLGPHAFIDRSGSVYGRQDDVPDDAVMIRRTGKHRAGRTLDGRTWDERPALEVVQA